MSVRWVFSLASALFAVSLAARSPVAAQPAAADRPPPDAIRQQFEQILSSEEYRFPREPQSKATWSRKLWDWLRRVLRGEWQAGLTPWQFRGLVVGLLLVLALILYHLFTVVRPALRRRAPPASSPRFVPDESAARDSARLRSLAAEHAAWGEYRLALRVAYQALLAALDERGLIDYDERRTNWEYVRALAHHGELSRALRPLTMTFDRKWYGEEETSAEEYEASMAAAERALEAIA